jgi:hypothetical protein
MVFGGVHGFGQLGWYFYSNSDYANAWTQVQALFELITQYWVWPRPGIDDPEGPGGPEGCPMDFYQVYEGDLIQYDWTNDGSWDHSVIIVRSLDLGLNNRFHWVAGHTPDVDDYPYTSFPYPNKVYRFIHIERIDGYAKSFLPLMQKYLLGSLQFPPTDPYSGPTDFGEPALPQAYPAP